MPKNYSTRPSRTGILIGRDPSGRLRTASANKSGTADKVTTVNGGTIKREANSGRFLEVRTPDGTSKASEASAISVREASNKRSAALKRLADR